MANQKRITDLPLILSGDITSQDVLPIVNIETDITNKIALSEVATYIQSGIFDIYVTGGTYSAGTITFTNNIGDTFDVIDLYTGETSYVNSLVVGDGLSANTTTDNVTIINTSPDQVVTISGGTGILSSGDYPNFNISFTGLSSGDCVTNLYVSNIHGCSPITIHDSLQTSGATAFGKNSFSLGLNTEVYGDYSQGSGVRSKVGITNAYSGFASGSTITLGSIYGDVSGQFVVDDNIYFKDVDIYSEFLGEVLISASTYNGLNTIIYTNTYGFGGSNLILVPRFYIGGTNGDQILSGAFSNTEGYENLSFGDISHAEGVTTSAIGIGSHTEGVGTKAYGALSHAEGEGTTTYGNSSHSEGQNTLTYGEYSHAEGVYGQTGINTAFRFDTIINGVITLNSEYNPNSYINCFPTNKPIVVFENLYDPNSVGSYLVSGTTIVGQNLLISLYDTNLTKGHGYLLDYGFNCGNKIVYGYTSHVEGYDSRSVGSYSHAEGYASMSFGFGSNTKGLGTITSGPYQLAVGKYNDYLVNDVGAFIIGNGEDSNNRSNLLVAANSGVTINGNLSVTNTISATTLNLNGVDIVDTYWSASTGVNAIVVKNSNSVASGDNSLAEGSNTTASGPYSHSEGQYTTASGEASHAEGQNTTASGTASHAEGYLTIAKEYAHAEGYNTKANGSHSHAGGRTTTASGNTSFIHSSSSVVLGDRSVVLGGQNITGTTNDTVYVPDLVIKRSAATPTTTSDAVGEPGSVTWDNTYFYVKTATGWGRILLDYLF